jgi:hypothetical protein
MKQLVARNDGNQEAKGKYNVWSRDQATSSDYTESLLFAVMNFTHRESARARARVCVCVCVNSR